MTRPDRVRTNPDLAELGPLSRVIARTLRDTPIRLGDPDTTPGLVGALTVAVAAYIGREVLPSGELDQARPVEAVWVVEGRGRNDEWTPWSGPLDSRTDALQGCATAAGVVAAREFRVVRHTTITTIEPVEGSSGADQT